MSAVVYGGAMYITADNVKAGSVVITENEPANMIYFVADGRVKGQIRKMDFFRY